MPNDILLMLSGAVVSGFLSGGLIWKLLSGGVREDLRRTFATVEQLNGYGSRVKAVETLVIAARDAADSARDAISRIEIIQSAQWERIADHVIKPLQHISERQEEQATVMASLSQSQALLAQSIEHLREMLDHPTRPRRIQ